MKEILKPDDESKEYLFAANNSPSPFKQDCVMYYTEIVFFRTMPEMHKLCNNLCPALDIPGGADKVWWLTLICIFFAVDR